MFAFESQRRSDALADGSACPDRIELQLALHEAAARDATQREVGIGHGGLSSAAAERHGTGLRAGATRADTQNAARIHRGDRSAPSADLHDIEHRRLQRKAVVVAADIVDRLNVELPVLYQRTFGGGAAHVKGDQLRHVERHGVGSRTNTTANGTGLDQRHGLLQRTSHRQHAAVRTHHVKSTSEAALSQALVESADVAAHARANVGIGGGSGCALVLKPLARQQGARRHVDTGQTAFQ